MRGPVLSERVTFTDIRAPIPAQYREPAQPFHPLLAARLDALGIARLWSHQARAVDLLRDSQSIVVATGTASGKTLCYQLPIVDAIVRGEPATSLLIYPTKALAQDQLRRFREWLVPDLVAATYDGDTPPDDRVRLRKQANVVLTNPEMLHVGILPFHERWATFLMRLQYVVIDELHSLRGIFGGHVAHVLRRLRRLCEHYGADPTFCFSSATIGNPGPLASTLAGMPIQEVTDDGAPVGARAFACWQRPLTDPHSGTRSSANAETAALVARFVSAGHQTLAFSRSRNGAEIIASQARSVLQDGAREPGVEPPRVAAYRAGYLPAERRELESALTTGELGGIVATSALELGIDVGGLDAIVVNGFPGTLASFRQQIGRAGRGGRGAATVLVAGDDQLDQWYAAHPSELLRRAAEAAIANPDNPFVLKAQVGCAAHELPIEPTDERWFGPGLDDAVRELVLADCLKPRDGRMYWAEQQPPAPGVGLRSGFGVEYELTDQRGEAVGTVDAGRVFQVAHPGAVYLHQGRQYRVETLDTEHHRVILEPADDLDEYTRTREQTDLTIVASEQSASAGRGSVSLGAVEVTTQITGFQRKRRSTNETIEVVRLEVPPSTLITRACWYTVPLPAMASADLASGRILGAVHAAEHALIGLLPLFAICDRWDVGGVSMANHPATEEPSIFVYDGYAGGAGIAELAFERLEEHIRAARDLVAACPCDAGCPSCVQSPKCGNWNEHLDKPAAVVLLDLLTSDRG